MLTRWDRLHTGVAASSTLHTRSFGLMEFPFSPIDLSRRARFLLAICVVLARGADCEYVGTKMGCRGDLGRVIST